VRRFLNKFSPPLSPSQIDEIVEKHNELVAAALAEKRLKFQIQKPQPQSY